MALDRGAQGAVAAAGICAGSDPHGGVVADHWKPKLCDGEANHHVGWLSGGIQWVHARWPEPVQGAAGRAHAGGASRCGLELDGVALCGYFPRWSGRETRLCVTLVLRMDIPPAEMLAPYGQYKLFVVVGVMVLSLVALLPMGKYLAEVESDADKRRRSILAPEQTFRFRKQPLLVGVGPAINALALVLQRSNHRPPNQRQCLPTRVTALCPPHRAPEADPADPSNHWRRGPGLE